MFIKYADSFEELIKNELIEINGQYVKLTRLGLDLANQVFVKFI